MLLWYYNQQRAISWRALASCWLRVHRCKRSSVQQIRKLAAVCEFPICAVRTLEGCTERAILCSAAHGHKQ